MNAIVDRSAPQMEDIRFAFGTCSLGIVLVAVSTRGVVAILLDDDRDALRRALANAFPRARLAAAETALRGTVATVVTFLDAPHGRLDLPLDIRGSALEQSVWQALRDVPVGRTTTYGQVARALPLAATAQDVGAACAANVLAVAIPCHRVIKADGSIAGYRWGVQRKRKLTNRERAA
ncbi:methylated-DNA--[protein]-cysteine S-methyltransferase [Luteimonas suaedae]|uniref:methylated-DNA--[protein]-cysteine S-methyltransferase n=1 Tax=Luteimonas suaedae TaxID=2605430 RepID=UPI001CA9986D|nr:methylated-DNA--[protein]-cysteine S-methyltransferase [Luteimonas suaedae]